MGWKVNLVLSVEKKSGGIIVTIEEELGDLALGLRQRLGVDQVHCRMKCMACCFFCMVCSVIVVTAVLTHAGSPMMLCGQFMVLCGMAVQVIRTGFMGIFVFFVVGLWCHGNFLVGLIRTNAIYRCNGGVSCVLSDLSCWRGLSMGCGIPSSRSWLGGICVCAALSGGCGRSTGEGLDCLCGLCPGAGSTGR